MGGRVIAAPLRLEDMRFSGRAATVASRDAGVKPTRMYLRRVAAGPVEHMSIHRTFRLRSFSILIMDMNPAIVKWDSNWSEQVDFHEITLLLPMP